MTGRGLLVSLLLTLPLPLAAQERHEPIGTRDTALARAAATWGCDYDTVATARAAGMLAANRGTARAATGPIRTACQALAHLGVPDVTRFADSTRTDVLWGYRPPRSTALRLRRLGETWQVTEIEPLSVRVF